MNGPEQPISSTGPDGRRCFREAQRTRKAQHIGLGSIRSCDRMNVRRAAPPRPPRTDFFARALLRQLKSAAANSASASGPSSAGRSCAGASSWTDSPAWHPYRISQSVVQPRHRSEPRLSRRSSVRDGQ
eukprot:1521752-Pyramimonas_sp.AAC.1